jgi:hypothetical protein
VARGVQGIGGAVLFPVSLALLAQDFRGRDRATAFSIWGATTGGAVAVGPLVGGALTDGLSWPWIFYLNVPVGIVAVLITMRYVRESKDPHPHGIDWGGTITFTAGLFCLVLALIRANDDGWGSTRIVSLFVATVVLLAVFMAIEARRGDGAMFDQSLFRRPAFKRCLDRGVRVVGVDVRDVPVPDALHADHPRVRAVRRGAALPPRDGAGVLLRRRIRTAHRGRPDAVPDGEWPGGDRRRAAPDARGRRRLRVDRSAARHDPRRCRDRAGQPGARVGVVPPQRSGMGSGINSTFRQVGIATGIAALALVRQRDFNPQPVGAVVAPAAEG